MAYSCHVSAPKSSPSHSSSATLAIPHWSSNMPRHFCLRAFALAVPSVGDILSPHSSHLLKVYLRPFSDIPLDKITIPPFLHAIIFLYRMNIYFLPVPSTRIEIPCGQGLYFAHYWTPSFQNSPWNKRDAWKLLRGRMERIPVPWPFPYLSHPINRKFQVGRGANWFHKTCSGTDPKNLVDSNFYGGW